MQTFLSFLYHRICTDSGMVLMAKVNKLEEADIIARKVRKIQKSMNTFLSSCAYSKKEERGQIENLIRNHATESEIALCRKAWKRRRELSEKGMKELEEYLEDDKI